MSVDTQSTEPISCASVHAGMAVIGDRLGLTKRSPGNSCLRSVLGVTG